MATTDSIKSERKKVLALFIHGLGGDSTSWGAFHHLITQDPQLHAAVEPQYFSYPTSLFRRFGMIKSIDPQKLADGLRTTIENKYKDYERVLLVCHSMGGLVGKQCVSDLQRAGSHNVKGIIFYATPHHGSELAGVANALSSEHDQAASIKIGAPFLSKCLDDWTQSGCEVKIDTTYVVAGRDQFVKDHSARGPLGSRYDMVLEAGHISVSKPVSTEDIVFLIFKNAVKRLLADENAEFAALLDAINEGNSHAVEQLVATNGRSWIEREDASKAIQLFHRVEASFDEASPEVVWSKYLLILDRLFRNRDTSSTAISEKLIEQACDVRLGLLLLAEKMELARKRPDRDSAMDLFRRLAVAQQTAIIPARSAGESYSIGVSHFLVANLLRSGGAYTEARKSIELAQSFFRPAILSHQTELAHCNYALEVCRSMTGSVTTSVGVLRTSSEYRPFAEALLTLVKSHRAWEMGTVSDAIMFADSARVAFERIGYAPYSERAGRLWKLLDIWRKLSLGANRDAILKSGGYQSEILRAMVGTTEGQGTIQDKFSSLKPSSALGLLQIASTFNPNWTVDLGPFNLPPLLVAQQNQFHWKFPSANSLFEADQILRSHVGIAADTPLPLIAD